MAGQQVSKVGFSLQLSESALESRSVVELSQVLLLLVSRDLMSSSTIKSISHTVTTLKSSANKLARKILKK